MNTPEPLDDDPMMTYAGPESPEWTRRLPVSVNDTYGDPFIPEQIDNTAFKLRALEEHEAPIAIFTKAGYDAHVLSVLAKLPNASNIVIYYSLTALDEGGISFDERLHVIKALTEIFPHTFVFTRPIIRKKNDDPATLRMLAEAAAEYTGRLVLGGIHDSKKRKQLDFSVEEQLLGYCDELGVKAFFKTSCAAAWAYARPCWVHDLGPPRNLDAMVTLGYQFAANQRGVFLEAGTTGDINFVRMLTGADVYVQRLLSNYNILTIPTGDRKLEATSSWFAWSENIDTCLDCSYCIIKQIEYLKKMRVRIGVHPTRLPEIIQHPATNPLEAFKYTKLPATADACHTYADVRTVKPCRARHYPSPTGVRREPADATPR
ncbi:MAG TPA: hypothetical protein VIL34_06620 [Actinopolymorphaceae bacterium]